MVPDTVKTCPMCGGNTTVYWCIEKHGMFTRWRKCRDCDHRITTVEISRDDYEKLLAKAGELK